MKREPAVRSALSKMYRSGKNTGVLHDMKCTGAMHPLSSDVIKVTLPPPHPPPPLMTVLNCRVELKHWCGWTVARPCYKA